MKKPAPFFVLLAGILWGTMGIYVRKLNALGFTTMEIVAVRSVVTAVLLLCILFFYNKLLPHMAPIPLIYNLHNLL